MTRVDLLVVGAGPAGMAAAVIASSHGLDVLVIDEQPRPGGQIWRAVEDAARRDHILGPSYVEGRVATSAFRGSRTQYRPGAQLWQIEPGFRAFVTEDGRAEAISAQAVVLATGAQERPVPFPGWTLPGVLTVGAAQILLKSAGQVPDEPLWIAGSGPLPLLYAIQLLRAGGRIAGYLDTTPAGQWRAGLRHLPGALRASGELVKGLGWTAGLRTSGIRYVGNVTDIAASGDGVLERVSYRSGAGATKTVQAGTLLVHEGVVPNIHSALALKCVVEWNDAQDSFAPTVDGWGESSQENVFIAGDGAGIAGAKAAQLRGELAGLRVAIKLGAVRAENAIRAARPIRRRLARELAARPFLDAMFKPRPKVFAPDDEAIVCRCEEVTAGEIRRVAGHGRPGPNQLKAATRAGMGPCQGRQCAYTVTRILAAEQGRSPAEVGFLNIRSPLKPVTLGELASLAEPTQP